MQKSDKSLLIIACPKEKDQYYGKNFETIANFIVGFAQAVYGNDSILVIADKATAKLLEPRLPPSILLIEDVNDIWLRDYSPAFPSNPALFTYKPNYLKSYISSYVQDWLKKIMKEHKLVYKELNKIILDGGNFVDNNKDQVIITERIFEDNPKLKYEELCEIFKKELGITHLTIIPYDKEDKTGHSDGIVAFLDETTVAVCEFPEYPEFTKTLLDSLKAQLKEGTKIVSIPTTISCQKFDGFYSADGLYVNLVSTNGFVYVPTFGKPAADDAAIKIIENALEGSKKVIPVDAKDFSVLGGSVRCASWQLQGDNAEKVLDSLIKKK